MKRIALTTALILASVVARAGEMKFINSDGSPLSQLCVAAVTSDKPANALAQDLGLAPLNTSEIVCNNQSLMSFVQQYRAPITAAYAQSNYVMSVANQTPETLLCMAALTSDEKFAQIKAAHFGTELNLEQSIRCNDMPLREFVRKYRAHVVSTLSPSTAAL